MTIWEVGFVVLVLAVAVAGWAVLRVLRRRAEVFPETDGADIPLREVAEELAHERANARKPIPDKHAAVDLPLDLPAGSSAEAARLGYTDSTMPAVQEPAPLRSARSVSNGANR